MEVLFVTHKYPPSVGGMEKQSFELTQGMKQYAKVHILCCEGSKVQFFWTLKEKIRAQCALHPGISVVHFNDGLAAMFCSGADDCPGLIRSVTLHGLDVVFPNTRFQRRILPRFNNFQSIIAVSQATANACIQRGIDAAKISVIPNGVDHSIADFRPNAAERAVFEEKYQSLLQGRINIILMGRPVLRKGFSWFLEQVLPQLPDAFQVIMIGPFRAKKSRSSRLLDLLPAEFRRQLQLLFGMPSDEDNLRRLLQIPALERRVRHLGKLPFSDVLQIMGAAQAFAMPNIHVEGDMEGFGLVCLEAALCGLPVLAAGTEGITDAIQHEKNGLLIESQNSAAWVAALLQLQKYPEALQNFGKASRQYTLTQFGWDKMVQAYYRHFEVLVSKNGHSD